MVLKAVAAALSGSLSVISSLVDSIMDLVSGFIIWLTSSVMKKRKVYEYPTGTSRCHIEQAYHKHSTNTPK